MKFEDGKEPLTIEENAFYSYLNQNYIYIGRNLEGATLPLSDVKFMTVGAYVTDLSWFEPSSYYNLSQITLDCETPPAIGRFTEAQHENILVLVPEKGIANYQNNQSWAFFNTILTMNVSSKEYEPVFVPDEVTLNVGERLELYFGTEPNIYTYLYINSSDPCVIIPEFGIIEAAYAGESEICLMLPINGKCAYCKVTVIQPATDIKLSKTELSLNVGESANLFANVTPVDASDTNVTWSSSDESIATVENGVVTAISGGVCEIIATTHNGLQAICNVTVNDLNGIENVNEDLIEWDVYSAHGMLIKTKMAKEEIKTLPVGIYIIKSKGKTLKVCICE